MNSKMKNTVAFFKNIRPIYAECIYIYTYIHVYVCVCVCVLYLQL